MAKYTTMVQLVALRLSIRLELSNLGRLPMTKVYVCIPVSHNIQSRKEQKTSSPRRGYHSSGITARGLTQPGFDDRWEKRYYLGSHSSSAENIGDTYLLSLLS